MDVAKQALHQELRDTRAAMLSARTGSPSTTAAGR